MRIREGEPMSIRWTARAAAATAAGCSTESPARDRNAGGTNSPITTDGGTGTGNGGSGGVATGGGAQRGGRTTDTGRYP